MRRCAANPAKVATDLDEKCPLRTYLAEECAMKMPRLTDMTLSSL
jgi:hypothetical protein